MKIKITRRKKNSTLYLDKKKLNDNVIVNVLILNPYYKSYRKSLSERILLCKTNPYVNKQFEKKTG